MSEEKAKIIYIIDDLVAEIIKIQHDCTSDRTAYSGKFIPIVDERVLIWQKGG